MAELQASQGHHDTEEDYEALGDQEETAGGAEEQEDEDGSFLPTSEPFTHTGNRFPK